MNNHQYRYILNQVEHTPKPEGKTDDVIIEEILGEIKNSLKEKNIDEIVECLKRFDQCCELYQTSSPSDSEMNFVFRISKWLLMSADESIRNDPRVIREYIKILDFGICSDCEKTINYDHYGFLQHSAFFQFPPKNIQVWKETVNYCLSLIDVVNSEDSGIAIVYALRKFIYKDQSIKEQVRERRDKLIEMMKRLTKFPNNQTLLKDTQALMVYWTLHLLELSGSEKWDGRIEQKTVLEKFQGFYLRELVKTLPTKLLERIEMKTFFRYRIFPAEPNEIITEIFNVVNSCYLKNGESATLLFDDFLEDCLSKFSEFEISSILDRPDIEIDELMIHSIVRYLKIDPQIQACKRIGWYIFNFLKNNPNQINSELQNSIIDLYFSLSKRSRNFEEYCDNFENEETRVGISNIVLPLILTEYMKTRNENILQYQKATACFVAFGKSCTIIDAKYLTFILDYSPNLMDYDMFETFANIIQNTGNELMKVMDNELCNQLENILENSHYRCNFEYWFAVVCSALETGLFWKIVEKSRRLSNPDFTITEEFRQGYTLEMIKDCRKHHDTAYPREPPFRALYFLWFLVRENFERSTIFKRSKVNELYRSLVDLSLISRLTNDSIFIVLLLAELEDNVDDNMHIILYNIEKISNSFFQNKTIFLKWTARRILENLEKFLYYFKDSTKLRASYKDKLKHCLPHFPGCSDHSDLLEKITALLI